MALRGLMLAMAASAAVAACGSTSALRPARPATSRSTISRQTATIAVIVRWADALRRGDVRTAARLFGLPSTFQDGPNDVVAIRTFSDAVRVNAGLPCGAQFVSSTTDGQYVNALFRLTGRAGPGGSNCGSGAGQTARTIFEIKNGRIVEWLRAPDQPGDNGGPGTSTAGSGAPI